MAVVRNSTERILSLVGVGTALSLSYSAFNYGVQITLVELFGYHLRGVFELMMSLVGLVSLIFSFNFYTAINLYISKNRAVPENLKKVSLPILLAQILAVLIMFLVYKRSEVISTEHYMFLLLVLILATLFNHKVNEFTAVLNGHRFFIEAKLLSLYGSIFATVLVFINYFLGFRDEILIVSIAVVGPFVGSYIYSEVLKRKKEDLGRQLGILHLKSLYLENRGVYLISLAQFVSIKLYLLYIARTESLEVVGIFSLAYSIIQFLLLPATFLATIVLSNPSDSLAALKKSFKLLVVYGVISGFLLKIAISLNLLQMLHLKSFQNPKFIAVLDIMSFSIPFSVLNILVVATAIRKNLCTKLFILSQLVLIPFTLVFYIILNNILASENAVSGAYVLSWILASLFAFAGLKQQLIKQVG